MRSAQRVIKRVAIRDAAGVDHKRCSVVEVNHGQVALYRDVDESVLIRIHDGWAIERGLVVWAQDQGIERVHYRVKGGGELYAANTDQLLSHGIPLVANERSQLVLPRSRWTRYAPDMAYDVPVAEVPWEVVDHETGVSLGIRGNEEPDLVSVARFEAEHAMWRIRERLEHKREVSLAETARDAMLVLDYLWRVDEEAMVAEAPVCLRLDQLEVRPDGKA